MSFFIRNPDGLFATVSSCELISEEQLATFDTLLSEWKTTDPAWAIRAQAVREAIEPFRLLGQQWNALCEGEPFFSSLSFRLHTITGWNALRPHASLSAEKLHLMEQSFDAMATLQALRVDFDLVLKHLSSKSTPLGVRVNPLRGAQRMLDDRAQWRIEEKSHAQRLLSNRCVVVLNTQNGLYLGENSDLPDIHSARSYETLGAAQRSLSARGYSNSMQHLALVEVQMQLVKILSETTTDSMHVAVQEAFALKERETLQQALELAPLDMLRKRVAELEAQALSSASPSATTATHDSTSTSDLQPTPLSTPVALSTLLAPTVKRRSSRRRI